MTQTYKLSVEEICMKLKPVLGKKIDEIYLKYTMADTREEREEIEQILSVLYSKNLSELLNRKVLLEPPKKEELDGEYPLAVVSYADKNLCNFNLREQDWIRHVCISGMSGSGKTTLAFHIINNFIKKEKPFLIFDWKKSFRPLMLVDGEILCFTVGNESVSNFFKMNINQPPEGVSPKEWINVLCDLITESFFASYGVHKVLLETLDEAFKDLGVYNGSRNYPTWNEIKWRLENKLENTRGRTATWLESALRIAHVLTFGNFGKTLNYKGKDCMTVENLLDKKIIFELNSLGTIEKKFFCEFVLTYIYKLKKANQTRLNEAFDHAILVDEAHNIFLKDKTHFVKESVTDVVYREMREYGTCLICLDQHISKISDSVVGNSACHVAFQQQLPQDVEAISSLMQLRERRQYFSMLPVGSAIVKLAERYTSPFLIKVPDVSLRKKEVFDREVAQRMKFIFEAKTLEQKDPEFAQALMQKQEESSLLEKKPEVKEIEEIKNIEEAVEAKPAAKPAIEFKPITEFREKEEKLVEELEKKEEKIELPLTNVQEILYEYVEKKLGVGTSLKEIERFLERNTIRGNYSIIDVSKVINCALKTALGNGLPKSVTTTEKQKVYKEEEGILPKQNDADSGNEKEKFLAFLKENSEHEHSTIELYSRLGLSARKGNKIKNELLQEGKIKIQEKKNSKGWKKIITLS